MIEIINKAKSWFFRKINKIDKSLLDWWRKNSERAHNDNYTEMKGIIMLDFIDINITCIYILNNFMPLNL